MTLCWLHVPSTARALRHRRCASLQTAQPVVSIAWHMPQQPPPLRLVLAHKHKPQIDARLHYTPKASCTGKPAGSPSVCKGFNCLKFNTGCLQFCLEPAVVLRHLPQALLCILHGAPEAQCLAPAPSKRWAGGKGASVLQSYHVSTVG